MVRVLFLVPLLCLLALSRAAGFADGQEVRAVRNISHQIHSILDSISAENIHRYLDTLVGVTYRHTLDDTVSLTVGMGAARRWIYKKFQEISAASGGRLQPTYFDFVSNICGVTRLHRNVMAILPGTRTPDRYFVVSGHTDTRGDPNSACIYNIISPATLSERMELPTARASGTSRR